ncbi:altronate dehydratase [Mucilaginibacter terrigena]|uniref:Altronate dehydratase n=1 Tax=Mucilaginibacter terrigena TaxID=2492395 RepID=A0A4Q5LPU5_9SPHI|nr:altronate dehydratase family protein [Mucilaginibacter terrigena]RYU91446.1 altronate dehydratase [Mucilaginibacter terrigena]
MNTKVLQIHPGDNITVALTNLPKGTVLGDVTLLDDIPAKHKFANKDFAPGDKVTMYGVLVGKATAAIPRGGLVSVKNVMHAAGSYELHQRNTQWDVPDVSAWADRTFMGYHRADGSVGTGNFWLIVPLVFCENKNVQTIHTVLQKELGYYYDNSIDLQRQVSEMASAYKSGSFNGDAGAGLSADNKPAAPERLFPNIDGIKFLNHTMGCAGTREDTRGLCGLLAGYITHPNVAGATVLSLGCQNAQIKILQEEIDKRDAAFSKPMVILEQQDVGTEEEFLRRALKQTFAGLVKANDTTRQPAPLNKLCVGLECGGSDGFSGLSANPALGLMSDILVALGGSVILSEFPELCGVEQGLSDRCITDEVAQRFMGLMTAYADKARSVGSGFESNPSAGNVRDGLITDAMKSAGAARKGGNSPITDVLDYPEKVTKPGLNLLCTPGSDVESTTAEVGSGANIVVFTTGLGTPTGNPVAPVLKVSTNTALFNKMSDIIDINAGTIIDGTETLQQMAGRMLNHVIEVASGNIKAKADTADHNDFIPWKRGISL